MNIRSEADGAAYAQGRGRGQEQGQAEAGLCGRDQGPSVRLERGKPPVWAQSMMQQISLLRERADAKRSDASRSHNTHASFVPEEEESSGGSTVTRKDDDGKAVKRTKLTPHPPECDGSRTAEFQGVKAPKDAFHSNLRCHKDRHRRVNRVIVRDRSCEQQEERGSTSEVSRGDKRLKTTYTLKEHLELDAAATCQLRSPLEKFNDYEIDALLSMITPNGVEAIQTPRSVEFAQPTNDIDRGVYTIIYALHSVLGLRVPSLFKAQWWRAVLVALWEFRCGLTNTLLSTDIPSLSAISATRRTLEDRLHQVQDRLGTALIRFVTASQQELQESKGLQDQFNRLTTEMHTVRTNSTTVNNFLAMVDSFYGEIRSASDLRLVECIATDIRRVCNEVNTKRDEVQKRQEHISGRTGEAREQLSGVLMEAEKLWSAVSEVAPQETWAAIRDRRDNVNQSFLSIGKREVQGLWKSRQYQKGSRAAKELPEVRRTLQNCRFPNLIGLEEYQEINWDDPREYADSVALFSMEDATAAIKEGVKPFKIPILIPTELNNSSQRPFDIQHYLDVLSSKEDICIHEYLEATLRVEANDEAGGALFNLPILRSGGEVVKLLQKSIANVLDSRFSKFDPPCMSDPEYTLLDDVGANKTIGKGVISEFTDAAFGLVSSSPAWSLSHRDRHGTVTGIENKYGRKLWPMRPRLPGAELKQARKQWAMLAVGLVAGDILLMPPSTTHAPMTLPSENGPNLCVMEGRMYLSRSGLVHSIKQTIEDEQDQRGTNENSADDFVDFMQRCIKFLGMKGDRCQGARNELQNLQRTRAQLSIDDSDSLDIEGTKDSASEYGPTESTSKKRTRKSKKPTKTHTTRSAAKK